MTGNSIAQLCEAIPSEPKQEEPDSCLIDRLAEDQNNRTNYSHKCRGQEDFAGRDPGSQGDNEERDYESDEQARSHEADSIVLLAVERSKLCYERVDVLLGFELLAFTFAKVCADKVFALNLADAEGGAVEAWVEEEEGMLMAAMPTDIQRKNIIANTLHWYLPLVPTFFMRPK